MERLNDIMQRSARRQQSNDQRSLEAQPPEGHQPGQLPPRRPLLEQTARLGQQSAQTRGQLNGSPQARSQHEGTREGRSPKQVSRLTHSRQRLPANNATSFQQHFQNSQRPLQESEHLQRRTTGEHFEVEPRVPPVQADVLEEWEDDTAAMRYGDWENEAEDEFWPPESSSPVEATMLPEEGQRNSSMQPRAKLERYAVSQRTLATRELSSSLDSGTRMRPSHNLREVRGITSQPPAPEAPTQEQRLSHRVTQPLDPQTIVRLSHDMPQEASRLQQTRQGGARELPALPAPQNAHVAHTGPCPICKGAGYLRLNVPYGHPNFGKPIACECKEAERAEKRRQQLREMSNLGAFRDKSFRNFNPRVPGVHEAYQIATEYAQNPEGWLVFIGRNGCGKTHLAAAIANQRLARGSLVLFATVPDLLDHLRATFAPTSNVVYDQLFSTMREAELLILDDLGAEQNSPWASEKLFQLLNYRYNSRFPTVITTNNVRLQAVDERIRSRLMDSSLVSEVRFEQAYDYRPHNPRRE